MLIFVQSIFAPAAIFTLRTRPSTHSLSKNFKTVSTDVVGPRLTSFSSSILILILEPDIAAFSSIFTSTTGPSTHSPPKTFRTEFSVGLGPIVTFPRSSSFEPALLIFVQSIFAITLTFSFSINLLIHDVAALFFIRTVLAAPNAVTSSKSVSKDPVLLIFIQSIFAPASILSFRMFPEIHVSPAGFLFRTVLAAPNAVTSARSATLTSALTQKEPSYENNCLSVGLEIVTSIKSLSDSAGVDDRSIKDAWYEAPPSSVASLNSVLAFGVLSSRMSIKLPFLIAESTVDSERPPTAS